MLSTLAFFSVSTAKLTYQPFAFSEHWLNIPAAAQAGACSGADDQAKWTGGGSDTFHADLSKCGKQCLGGESCTSRCIKKKGYTQDCAKCFGSLTNCSKNHCLMKCLPPKDTSAKCADCVNDKCTPAFTACSGLTPPKEVTVDYDYAEDYQVNLGDLQAIEASNLKVTFKDCGTASTHGKTDTLTPTSMALGATTTMSGTGTCDEEVTGGSFKLDLRAGGGLVHQTFRGNFCQPASFKIKALGMTMGTVKWDGVACPVPAGPSKVNMDVMLSRSIPRNMAASTIKMTAVDQNGEDLLCVEVQTK